MNTMSTNNTGHSAIGIAGYTGLVAALTGLLVILLAWMGLDIPHPKIVLGATVALIAAGTVLFSWRKYMSAPAGIHNNGVWFNSLSSRGIVGWLTAIMLTGFYVCIYWFPGLLGLSGEGNTGLVALFDPLSMMLKNQKASEWFVYGTIYTLLILSLGFKFMLKYRHNRYQLIRTSVVMVSQLFLAYIIPEIMEGLNTGTPYFAKDLKYMWPLNYYFFQPWHLDNMGSGGALGRFYLVWGIALFAVITPVLTYFYGKRWYCSWVCGCGGLAETAGDSFRQLSSKSTTSWKLERWLIHGILLIIALVTAVVLYGYFTGSGTFLGLDIYTWFYHPYAFLIGAAFSGVIGVGFYPLLGNRVWCRFGCPLAAYMGIIQRFKSRFRITVNGGQCISCGNCSTYCEQGIDVRSYAQKGQNVVRASCVGCGICAAVCPRGVLRLENGPEKGRIRLTSSLNPGKEQAL